jgi:O-antigen/teichoic acid export membrane protein
VFIHLTGPKFREARNVIPVLMLAKLFLGVYYNISIWYKLTGKTLWGALITVAGALVTIGLNIYWIPLSNDHLIFGYYGSAWATFFCYTTMMVLGYLIGQKYFPIPYNLKKFFGYIGLSLVLYFFSRLIQTDSWFLNAGSGIALLAVFTVVVFLIEKPKLT